MNIWLIKHLYYSRGNREVITANKLSQLSTNFVTVTIPSSARVPYKVLCGKYYHSFSCVQNHGNFVKFT